MIQVRRPALLMLLVLIALSASEGILIARGWPVSVRGDRWLAVSATRGGVELSARSGQRRPARRGDRLDRVGDTITTGANASARLDVDTATGSIAMAENSQLRVQALGITANGGRITELLVSRGQVRVQVRRLTNPETRLEIHTPAGVSGVRGTDFGVAVQPTGQTGTATLEGQVLVSAQGQTVTVDTAFQSLTRPGEPPTPPEPLRNDPSLSIETLRVRGSSVQIVGQTDPVNLLEIDNRLQALSRAGRFDLTLPLPGNRRIEAVVTTPLGTQQRYEIAVP